MLRFILLKIKNKYKLYLCLLIGLIFMEAVAALVIMFRTGSLNKLLQRNFVAKYEESGRFPAILSRVAVIDNKYNMHENEPGDDSVADEMTDDETDKTDIYEIMSGYEASWSKYLDIPMVSKQRMIYMRGFKAVPSFRGNSLTVDIGYMDELNEHIVIVDGEEAPENAYPCYVSEYTADTYDLVPGELLRFDNTIINSENIDNTNNADNSDNSDNSANSDNSGNTGNESGKENNVLTVYISGIIREKNDDYYWNKSLYENGHMIYVDKDAFFNILSNNDIELAAYEMYDMVDYRYINTTNVKRIESIISQFHDRDEQFTENITPVITAYNHESRSLMAILYVIALPLIILVLIFIWMMAQRIIDSEMGETAGFASRGIGRRRIIGMYVIQYLILCAAAFIPGIMLGYIIGKMTAGVDDFLAFHIGSDAVSTRVYTFTWQMLPAGIAALVAALIIMVIPVVMSSRSTLVEHRKKRVKASVIPFWERYFIDVLLLGLSLYLLHNYNKQLGMISEAVLNGEGIDPMIFADATLFLVAAGLIILRVIYYVIRLIYRLCGGRLAPAGYAGILQIIRTRKRSGIVSVFMVITVAMSLYNANMARTINANNEARLKLDLGSDYIIREHFDMKIKGQQPPQTWKYIEPEPALYNDIVNELNMDGFTKVIRDGNAEARNGSKVIKNATLMGINTKEFGNVANMKEDEGEKHWYYYLNDMAASADGCIISKNLADKLEVGVGDTLTYSRIAPVDSVGIYASATGRVAAIVDVWPGYEKYQYTYNEEGKLQCEENYLVAANYATVVSTFGITPYEIWMKGRPSSDDISRTIEKIGNNNSGAGGNAETPVSDNDTEGNGVDEEKKEKKNSLRDVIELSMEGTTRRLEGFESNEKNQQDMKGSALIQITNGLFTVDFLVALFLCVLGFMIYWISSIRDRELLFGIYRAMGISMAEIEKMLVLEQIFLTLVSIFAGVVSGGMATVLFGRLFAIVYLPKKHSIPLENIIAVQDVVRLFAVLFIAVILCMVMIRSIVKRLNIAEALKLGED